MIYRNLKDHNLGAKPGQFTTGNLQGGFKQCYPYCEIGLLTRMCPRSGWHDQILASTSSSLLVMKTKRQYLSKTSQRFPKITTRWRNYYFIVAMDYVDSREICHPRKSLRQRKIDFKISNRFQGKCTNLTKNRNKCMSRGRVIYSKQWLRGKNL